MADNMDEFLRRAAERRLQRAKRPDTPPPPPQQVAPPPRNVAPPRTLERQQPQRQQELSQRPLGKKQPQKQRSQPKQTLAQKIEKADDQMQNHLQSAFNHPVGQLRGNRQGASGPVTSSPKGNTPVAQPINTDSDLPLAQQIIEALKDPQQTKIAFVASEIFQRRF